MVKKQQITAVFTLLAAVWLAFAVVFAGVFIIAEHNHEHINSTGRPAPAGIDCRICLEMQIAQRIIESLCRLCIGIAITGSIVSALSFLKPQRAFCPLNLIELNVKSNC